MYKKTSGESSKKKVTDIFEILFLALTNEQYNAMFNRLAASHSITETKQPSKIKIPGISYMDKVFRPLPYPNSKVLSPKIAKLAIREAQYKKIVIKMKDCGLAIPAGAGCVSINKPLLEKIQGLLKKDYGEIASYDVPVFVDAKPPKPKKVAPEKDRLRIKIERIVARLSTANNDNIEQNSQSNSISYNEVVNYNLKGQPPSTIFSHNISNDSSLKVIARGLGVDINNPDPNASMVVVAEFDWDSNDGHRHGKENMEMWKYTFLKGNAKMDLDLLPKYIQDNLIKNNMQYYNNDMTVINPKIYIR